MIGTALAIPWTAALLLALLDGRKRWVGYLAVLALAASTATSALLATRVLSGEGTLTAVTGGWPAGIGIRLRADALGVAFLAVSTTLLLVVTASEVTRGIERRTFPALALFLTAGLTGLFLTADVFNFYVFFEVSMASAFVLTFSGERRRFLRAGLVFMVVNLVGSALFLFGAVALYRIAGTLDMRDVAAASAGTNPGTVVAATLVFVAFGVKLGLFPFHSWIPSVYSGTQPPIAALLSGVVANIGSYGLIRFGGEVLAPERELAAPVLLAIGGASILYGALAAVSGRAAADVLAYSSISQAGYILVALAIGGTLGLAAATLYSLANATNKTLLFLATGLPGALGAVPFMIGAVSLSGLPPTLGFFAKVSVLRAGVVADAAAAVVLVLVGSALSMAYIFPAYQQRFWRDERRSPDASGGIALAPWALAAGVVAAGVWPAGLLEWAAQAAAAVQDASP